MNTKVAKPFELSRNQNRIANAVLLAGFALLLVTLAASYKSDGQARYNLLKAMFTGGELNEKYSLFLPVLASPIYLVADLVGADPHRFVAYFNFAFTLLAGGYVYYLTRQRYGLTLAKFAAILLLATSMYSHHLQWFFGEVSAALVIAIAFFLKNQHRWISAFLMALAIWSTPAFLPAIAITAAAELWVTKFKNFRLSIATVLGGLFILADNFIKYGSFSTPYLSSSEAGGFSIPSLFIIGAVLFSFGKGIAFYIPGLFAFADEKVRSAFKLDRETKWVAVTFVVALILVYSAWWSWYGGWFWGPRFFLVLCLPAALAFAIVLTRIYEYATWQKIALFVLLALALWVGVSGYVFGQQLLSEACQENDYINESLCWYTVQYSALWNPFFGDGLIANFNQLKEKRRLLFAIWQICSVALLAFWALRGRKESRA